MPPPTVAGKAAAAARGKAGTGLKDTDILIAGGYGTVGRRIAADLAPDYRGRVVVAGRNAEKAAHPAAELGHGARGGRVDVSDPASVEAALDGVGVVISCIDQPEPHLLLAALARGLGYTDIAPHLMTRRLTTTMRAEAIRTGSELAPSFLPGKGGTLRNRPRRLTTGRGVRRLVEQPP